MSEQAFRISVQEDKLQQLKAKLTLTVFPDELEDAGWDYGVPLADMKRLVERWRNGYDWRKHETELNNELPQFTRDIDVEGFGTLNIHYVHQRSQVEDAIPLLFVHGWPGSFIEARKILPLLVASSPDHPSFHVVALSLPGYGFSEAPRSKGFSISQCAEVAHKLMLSLGYNEYVTQGGDWGYVITRRIAALYGGKHAKAWHTNFPLGAFPHPIHRPWLFLTYLVSRLTPKEKAGLARAEYFKNKGTGYGRQQGTKPQTLGYGLADSPVGLLAWIYEKLREWTDEYPWEDDEVLTWVSIYWFSRAGPAASLRIYKESADSGDLSMDFRKPKDEPTIPLGYSLFPKELVPLPKAWARYTGNTVFEAEHDKGGHFAAHEVPELLVGDLRSMFGKGGPSFGVVNGRTGYV
ncbi:hypothetical protein EYR40_005847 [Pleurotus pulmonarius]|nr:hypothetical protein EYR36_005764 [Pleurotus pulmonarius]KAF4602632.1 hypothetical protein EYR40_005847 [Pleurotus pulmonarius]